MSDDMMTAGTVLADVLTAENAALAALDLPRAGAMLARKQRALADLAGVQDRPTSHDAAERMARRLRGLAIENKRLLERAITAQGRVVGVIARAATTTTAPTGYGTARGWRPAAFALFSRA